MAIVWTSVLRHPLLPLVSPHPLLQSLGVFLAAQAVLVLQPMTRALAEGRRLPARRAHAALHGLSFLCFAAGTALIETNKAVHSMPHFHSAHAYLGVATVALLLAQYLFGATIWLTPAVWGGEEPARQLWKYHRYAGYGLLVLLLATAAAAAETDYNKAVLGIRLWTVLVAEVLIVVGVFPRIQLSKLGIQRSR